MFDATRCSLSSYVRQLDRIRPNQVQSIGHLWSDSATNVEHFQILVVIVTRARVRPIGCSERADAVLHFCGREDICVRSTCGACTAMSGDLFISQGNTSMELVTEKYLQQTDLQDETSPGFELPTDAEEHPSVYVHTRCGGATEMPDSIQFKYLADPCFFYSFLGSHCAKCGGGVPDSQLYWAETGESLPDYAKRIKWSKPRKYHVVRWLLPMSVAFLLTVIGALSILEKGEPLSLAGGLIAFVVWTAVVWWPLRYVRLILCFLKDHLMHRLAIDIRYFAWR